MAGGGDFVDMSTSSVITSDAMLDSILQNGEEDPGNQDGRERSEEKLQRVTLSYTPTYQRFRAKARTFTQQYSHMYTNRLRLMRPMLEAAATAKWGTGAPDGKEGEDAPTLCQKIIDLVDGARTSMVIGTIFKDMPLRPSLLDEYRDEAALQGALQPAPGPDTNYTSSEDTLVLEDESGRVTLSGEALPVGDFVTGLVVAAKGRAVGGRFLVEDVCAAGMPEQEAGPEGGVEGGVEGEAEGGRGQEPQYVMLMSGLRLSDRSDLLPLQLLIDYVQGHAGTADEKRRLVSRIGRVIVAGDLLAPFEASILKEKHMTSKQQEEFALPFKHVDLVLAQLASAVPVDVMPGADDPSNHTLPQQPIHPCILPHASRYTSFKTVPNPHEAWLQRRLFLGNAGQIPADLARSTAPPSLPSSPASSAARTLNLMEKTLHWRHLAPTAPDTLACYPFCDDDPFVLPSLPHVYFAGNQPAFAARLVEEGQEGGVEGKEGKKCLLVAVPSFAATGTVVLVNLNDLTATPLHFKGLPAQRQEREGKEGEGEEMEVEEGEGEEEN